MRVLAAIILILTGFIAPTGGVATAQEGDLASLSADRIVYTSGYRVLRASGHVVVLYRDLRLEAAALTYDQQNDRITAQGPLRLISGKNLTIIASFAELSGDMKSGVLKSARMVLNQQLQITALEMTRSEGKYNQLIRAAASSCTVSQAHPTPLWQIRARRIVHDEEKKRLYFEGAQLRIGNIPVAYVPRMRTPGPSVTRASGFLVPGLSNSSLLGASISAPYFITLGDYADLTLTPHVYSSGTTTLGLAFRKRFYNGRLDLTGAISNDTVSATARRGYLFGGGNWRIGNGFDADVRLELTSDDTYLLDHGISDATRLESHLGLGKTTRNTLLGADIRGYQSLSPAVAADEIPFLIGNAGIRRRWAPAGIGGRFGLALDIDSYRRASATDIVGRDTVRVSSVADWRREWIARSGLVFSTSTELHGDSTFPGQITRAMPIAAAEFRLPMARTGARATHVIEPRLQLVWSPSSSIALPDEDSQIVEFEAANLFALSHFSGIDRIEQGLRANIGVTYSRRSVSGWNVDAVIGKVIRAGDPGQFSVASGLSGPSSSYVLGAQLALESRFRLIGSVVFDDALVLSKSETGLAFQNKTFDFSTGHLWLVAGAAGNSADRSEWTADAGVNLTQKWRGEASWRYDFITSSASEAALAFVYRNECIKVDLSLSRRFAASSNMGPSTSLGLMVSLEGFGSRATNDTYQRRCNDL
ncbi:MAG: LPS-assembly protein LptD [Paracoccaceae bacterium]